MADAIATAGRPIGARMLTAAEYGAYEAAMLQRRAAPDPALFAGADAAGAIVAAVAGVTVYRFGWRKALHAAGLESIAEPPPPPGTALSAWCPGPPAGRGWQVLARTVLDGDPVPHLIWVRPAADTCPRVMRHLQAQHRLALRLTDRALPQMQGVHAWLGQLRRRLEEDFGVPVPLGYPDLPCPATAAQLVAHVEACIAAWPAPAAEPARDRARAADH